MERSTNLLNVFPPHPILFVYDFFKGAKTEYSLADQVERRVESPFQRFTRLRAELQELQADVTVMLEVTSLLILVP
jgi:hypothetical protein